MPFPFRTAAYLARTSRRRAVPRLENHPVGRREFMNAMCLPGILWI